MLIVETETKEIQELTSKELRIKAYSEKQANSVYKQIIYIIKALLLSGIIMIFCFNIYLRVK